MLPPFKRKVYWSWNHGDCLKLTKYASVYLVFEQYQRKPTCLLCHLEQTEVQKTKDNNHHKSQQLNPNNNNFLKGKKSQTTKVTLHLLDKFTVITCIAANSLDLLSLVNKSKHLRYSPTGQKLQRNTHNYNTFIRRSLTTFTTFEQPSGKVKVLTKKLK